ncbi:MAG: hypothetical protein ACYDGR_00540 [Candidatus Dormibacteria bacterium]
MGFTVRDGRDGGDDDDAPDLLEELIQEETDKDPNFPRKLDEEVRRQRQVAETRKALALEPVVDLADWRNSSDAEKARAILGRLREQKGLKPETKG